MSNDSFSRVFERLATTLLHNRVVAALAALVLFAAIAAGAAQLRPNFSLTAFYAGDDPAKVYFDEYSEFWGTQEMALIVVVTTESGDLLTSENIASLNLAADRLVADDVVEKVTNIANASWMRRGGGGVLVSPVHDTIPDPKWGGTAEELAEWRQQILADDAFVPVLISEDGTTGSMLVELSGNIDEIDFMVAKVTQVRALLAQLSEETDLEFAEAGVPAVRTDFFHAFYQDMMLFGPAMMLMMVLTLTLTLRKLHGVVIPTVAALVPTAMVMGVMGYLGADLDIVTQTLVTLLPAIAVADAIHLVSRFHEEARTQAPPGQRLSSEQRDQAIIRSLRTIGGACFLTSFTTAIGFVSLVMAQMPILRNFGIYAAVGVSMAYGSVLVVIPLMLSVTRGAVSDLQRDEAPTVGERFLSSAARFSTTRPKLVLSLSAVICAVFALMATQVTVDNNLTRMLYDSHPTTVANHISDTKLGGIIATEIDLKGVIPEGDEVGSIQDPALLQVLLTLEEEIKGWDSVRWVGSPATVVADAMELLSGERRIPETRAGVAQVLMLIEGHPGLEQVLSFDRARGRLVIRMRDRGARAFAAFSDRLNQRVDELLTGQPVVATQSGTITIAYRGINNVSHDLRDSIMLAFVVISAAVLLIFRNLRMVVAALVPTAAPLVCGYGLLYLLGWPLDPSSGMIFTVALGIAIDDSIHMLARYREERGKGLTVADAAARAVRFSGKAIAITSLMVGFGLGVNVFSSFPMVRVLGVIGAFMMGVALLCDVYLLPSLLVLLERD